jgi:hypothetical protein
MGTGDHEGRERADNMGRYMAFAGSTWSLRQNYRPPLNDLFRNTIFPMTYTKNEAISTQFLLDFRPFRAFNPPTSRKDVLFDPPPGP